MPNKNHSWAGPVKKKSDTHAANENQMGHYMIRTYKLKITRRLCRPANSCLPIGFMKTSWQSWQSFLNFSENLFPGIS